MAGLEESAPKIWVAHIRDQGAEFVLVPMGASFEQKPIEERREVVAGFEARAAAAGLPRFVVVVWDIGEGPMRYLGASNFVPAINDWTFRRVLDNLNREI